MVVVDDVHVVVVTRDHVLVVYMMLSWRGGTKLLVTVNRSRPSARPHQHGITVLSNLSLLNNFAVENDIIMIMELRQSASAAAVGGRRGGLSLLLCGVAHPYNYNLSTTMDNDN